MTAFLQAVAWESMSQYTGPVVALHTTMHRVTNAMHRQSSIPLIEIQIGSILENKVR